MHGRYNRSDRVRGVGNELCRNLPIGLNWCRTCCKAAKKAKKETGLGGSGHILGCLCGAQLPTKTKHLTYAPWSDNNIVKTLSNFHSSIVLPAGDGLLPRRRVDGVQEQDQTEVSCPLQQKDYSETFHLINKGNGKESKYDMGGQTKGHNWAPKLTMRYWNFSLDNAHMMYKALVKQYTPDRQAMSMAECVKFLAHSLMQCGPSMRAKAPEHPSFTRDLSTIFHYGVGRKIRTDAKGIVAGSQCGSFAVEVPKQRLRELKKKQKKSKCGFTNHLLTVQEDIAATKIAQDSIMAMGKRNVATRHLCAVRNAVQLQERMFSFVMTPRTAKQSFATWHSIKSIMRRNTLTCFDLQTNLHHYNC